MSTTRIRTFGSPSLGQGVTLIFGVIVNSAIMLFDGIFVFHMNGSDLAQNYFQLCHESVSSCKFLHMKNKLMAQG